MGDSEGHADIETGADTLLSFLEEKSKWPVSRIAEDLGVPEETVKKWAKALEKSGLVDIKYSAIKGMVLEYSSEKTYEELNEGRSQLPLETEELEIEADKVEEVPVDGGDVPETVDAEGEDGSVDTANIESSQEKGDKETQKSEDVNKEEDGEEEEQEREKLESNIDQETKEKSEKKDDEELSNLSEEEGKEKLKNKLEELENSDEGKKKSKMKADKAKIKNGSKQKKKNKETETKSSGPKKEREEGEGDKEKTKMKADKAKIKKETSGTASTPGKVRKNEGKEVEDTSHKDVEHIYHKVSSLSRGEDVDHEPGESLEEHLEKIKNLGDLLRNEEIDNDDVYSKMEQEMEALKDRLMEREISDEVRQEVAETMEKASNDIEHAEEISLIDRIKIFLSKLRSKIL